MFDIGWPELLLIAVAALILFGPSRLPEAARSLGKSIKAFKQGFKDGMEDEKAGDDKKSAPPDELPKK